MRRKDREITDTLGMESIILGSMFCKVAMCRNNEPYLVPFSFGYEDMTVYLHCAREGTKLDILRSNNRVCVEFDNGVELVRGENACNFSLKYRSVMAFGRAYLVDDTASKRKACDIIMRHYAEGHFEYTDQALDAILVIRIDIDEMTGKQSG